MSDQVISPQDEQFYLMAREHIRAFRRKYHERVLDAERVLEIGPGLDTSPLVETLDIDCTNNADITADITDCIPVMSDTYDTVIAMEVLEHTTDPFAALREIRRVMKDGGHLLASAPWNFRIHGPQPDLWRFNQNTWRLLLKDWDIIEMNVLETPDRWLMPIHINVLARCNKAKCVNRLTMKWEQIR